MNASRMSAVGFVAAILCFLMPFITLSCGGQNLIQLSGTQLAFGTTISQPVPLLGQQTKQKIDANPLATVAFLCAIGAAVMSIVRKGFPLVTGIAGVVGTVCLYLLRSTADDQIAQRGAGMITASFEPGYVVTLVLLLVLGLWNTYLFWTARQRRPVPAAPPRIPPRTPYQ